MVTLLVFGALSTLDFYLSTSNRTESPFVTKIFNIYDKFLALVIIKDNNNYLGGQGYTGSQCVIFYFYPFNNPARQDSFAHFIDEEAMAQRGKKYS